jgi:hypothetical protein
MLSILRFAVLALFGAMLMTASASASVSSERRWVRQLGGGQTEFVVLHGDGDLYTVDTVLEAPRRLPRLVSSRRFEREADALGFALDAAARPALIEELSFRAFRFFDSLREGFGSVGPASTEFGGASLWPVTQSWSWEWELKYAEWVRANVDTQFFVKHRLETDCADIAYAFRWIFARIHGLPAANRLIGSGVLFTQDSMLAEWAQLPTDADWSKDKRFRAALEYLLTTTYTHTLGRDSYPIEITTESFVAGIHHLSIHGNGGHTLFVRATDFSETTIQPIEILYSNLPRVVRELYRSGYWQEKPFVVGEDAVLMQGFLRFPWPVRDASSGSWALTPGKEHPHYSREQYLPEFMKDRSTFAEAVLRKLAPKLDFVARLKEGLADLREQLRVRKDVVAQGYEVCKAHGCPEGSQAYEDWSTFSRDARFKELYGQLEQLVSNLSGSVPALGGVLTEALKAPAIVLDGESYTLAAVLNTWSASAHVSDPRVTVTERWGLAPSSFASNIGKKLDPLLAERDRRIADQGMHCSSPGDCMPGSDGWTRWSSFDIDREIRKVSGALQGYCALGPAPRCEAFQKAQESIQSGLPGRVRSLKEWGELAFWLISDPRLGVDARWGSKRSSRRSYALQGQGLSSTQVGRAGLASVIFVQGSPAEGFSRTLSVFDLGLEVHPPEGYAWASFDTERNRAIALPLPGAPGSKATVRVIDPRSGLVFESPLFEAEKDLEAMLSRSGVLMVSSPKQGMNLFDLNASPATATTQLPLAPGRMAAGDPEIAWCAKTGGASELFLYEPGGRVERQVLTGLDAQEQVTFLDGRNGNAIVGGLTACSGNECSYRGAFIADARTGAIKLRQDANGALFVTKDGRWVARLVYGSPGSLELLELGDSLEVVSRRDLGALVGFQWNTPSGERLAVRDASGRRKLLRYAGGSWSEFELLSDEREFKAFEGDFVVTQTKQGRDRVRGFTERGALFESEPGSMLGLIGTREKGTRLPAVVVFHAGQIDQQSIYELSRPDEPLLTGAFKDTREMISSLGDPWGSLVMERGLMVPTGMSSRLWVDDL